MRPIYQTKALFNFIEEWGNAADPEHTKLRNHVLHMLDIGAGSVMLDDSQTTIMSRIVAECGATATSR